MSNSEKSRKAEKRQKRKERKRKELELKLAEEKVKFNILSLLQNELLDTKPNFAKFLKEHVQTIRCFNCNSKIEFWPKFEYVLSKIFVKFLDGHELIYDLQTDGKFTPKYYFCYQFDEIKLKDKDIPLIENFFLRLMQFKFVK